MVIKSALEKLKRTGLNTYISSLNIILSGIKTNLTPAEIVVLGYKTLRIGTDNLKTLEFPVYKEEVKFLRYIIRTNSIKISLKKV